MPNDTKEPQSYGSGKDWVTGKTGQRTNDPKSEPPPEHADFYESSHEARSAEPSVNGGLVRDLQDSSMTPTMTAQGEHAAGNVTTKEHGAKRDSFFRKRDYE